MQSLNPATVRISAVAALLFLSACQGCQKPDGGLALLKADAERVEFGKVAVGERKTLPIVLRNSGRAELHVGAIEFIGAHPAFEVEPAEGFSVPAGGVAVVRATFAPQSLGQAISKLRIVPVGAISTVDVELSGEGVAAACTLSTSRLDFGTVARGETARAQLVVENHSEATLTVRQSELSGDAVFSFDGDGSARAVEVPAHDSRAVSLSFHPLTPGTFGATLTLASVDGCTGPVILEGTAVEDAVVATPSSIGFGYVNPGGQRVRTIELRNLTTVPVTLDELEVSGEGFSMAHAGPLALAAKTTVQLRLTFSPPVLGQFAGDLRWASYSRALTGHAALTGTGGGAVIEVSPTVVDLGDVALGAFRDAVVTVSNSGVDVPGTDEDDLSFGEPDSQGQGKGPEASLTGSGEFVLATVLRGKHLGVGESLDVHVRFQPKSMGTQSALLHLYSNDGAHPERVVRVTATGTAMPHCEYEVRPAVLDFGRVVPGESLDRAFVITNRSTNSGDDCRVWLAAPGRGPFSLVSGAVQGALIKVGASLRVPVRFSPAAKGTYSAQLEVFTSSTLAPRSVVGLAGDSEESCLRFSPASVDFGATPQQCSSRDRVVTVVNVCKTPLQLATISTDLSGTAPFTAPFRPALPMPPIPPGGTIDVKVRYRPFDAGPHEGALLVQEQGTNAAYIAPLSGHTGAQMEELFPANPKVDVLVVADSTLSFAQAALELYSRFAYFTAATNGIDYQLGVTATPICTQYPVCTPYEQNYTNGRILPLTSGAERIIRPTSLHAESMWKDDLSFVAYGTGGFVNLLDTVQLGFGDQLRGHNAGLLRPDSLLSVVLMSDDYEYSDRADDYHAAMLRRLRAGANDVIVSGLIPSPGGPLGSPGPVAVGTGGGCLSSPCRPRSLGPFIYRFGGIAEDVNVTDWNAAVHRISYGAFGYRTRFELQSQVDPSALTVEVNGLAASGWSYVPAENALRFSSAAAIAPTDTLVVRYPVACLP